MKSIKILSVSYVACSVFLGPTIVFYALGRGKVGTDCSDASWDVIPQSVKAAYYHEAAVIMAISSVIMVGLGTFIIFRLLNRKRDAGAVILASVVGIIAVGYLLILIQANSWGC